MQLRLRAALAVVAFTSSITIFLSEQTYGVGVLYSDPGWATAYDGSTAFYNDPDGPNPDYINGNDQNEPGGKSNTAALINAPNDTAPWLHHRQQWDGSAPGDPLGGTPGSPPPIVPAAPGGVATYTVDSTSYLRIQDTGQPQGYGWTDKGAQFAAGTAKQEGNNRILSFKHPLDRDASFNGNHAVLDNGITISFRARLSTPATGPLDSVFPEGGTYPASVVPWESIGIGLPIHGNGRGMFMITEQVAAVSGQMGFSLRNSKAIPMGASTTKTGLVMNNRSGVGGVDTNIATNETLNVFELTDTQLTEWQEFWITVKALAAPIDGNTHEVNVYHNGSLVPQTFQMILGNQNEFGTTAHLGLGSTAGTNGAAWDTDFFAYKQGVIVPTLAPQGQPGDYNGNGLVDAADYVLWRNGGTLQNDATPGVQPGDYDVWKANFGKPPGSGTGSSLAAVPEPASLGLLLSLAAMVIGSGRRHRSSERYGWHS